jgi:hypothetical protein
VGLTVLCAGCPPEERERVSQEVKRALGARPGSDPWRVSLVKVKAQWMVSIDAPAAGLRGLTFSAPDERLAESIVEAVSGGSEPHPGSGSGVAASAGAPAAGAGAVAAGAGAPAAGSRRERRDRHECPNCHGAYLVVYDSEAGEAQDAVPVACPHCWNVDRVPVGRAAGLNRDYRAEKTSS